MDHNARYIDIVQLRTEVTLVEKTLAAASSPDTLDEAADLSLEFMKTQKTDFFSAIDGNEYVAYRFDVQRDKAAADNMENVRHSEENIWISLARIHGDLERARALIVAQREVR